MIMYTSYKITRKWAEKQNIFISDAVLDKMKWCKTSNLSSFIPMFFI